MRLGGDLGRVIGFERRLQISNRGFDRGLIAGRNLVAVFLELLFRCVDQSFALVLGFSQFTARSVIASVLFGFLDHALDVVVGKTARRLDAHVLFFVGRLILGADRDDAVGVDVECDFDLRHAARRRGDADEIELAERTVVRRHFALALEDADRYGALVVLCGREDLALLGRDRGVAFDQAREHAAERFNAEREWGDVEQNDVLHIALQHAGLDRGANGHDFIRVHALMRLAAEEFFHDLLDLRHARHAADEDNLFDVALRETSILQSGLAGAERSLHEILDQAFELGAADLHVQVDRATGVRGDERNVDRELGAGRELFLGLLSDLFETRQGELVLAQIDAVLLFELVGDVVEDTIVEVFAAEERVAIG